MGSKVLLTYCFFWALIHTKKKLIARLTEHCFTISLPRPVTWVILPMLRAQHTPHYMYNRRKREWKKHTLWLHMYSVSETAVLIKIEVYISGGWLKNNYLESCTGFVWFLSVYKMNFYTYIRTADQTSFTSFYKTRWFRNGFMNS